MIALVSFCFWQARTFCLPAPGELHFVNPPKLKINQTSETDRKRLVAWQTGGSILLAIADALRDRHCKILVIFWNCKAPVLSFVLDDYSLEQARTLQDFQYFSVEHY
jgi:hypothetical protein